MASTKKSGARKSAARKSTRKATGTKAARGAKQRSPLSVKLVDGDRAKDPTVGKNVATAPKSTKEAGAGTKGRSIPSGTTVESARRGSGNPPGPHTTAEDRKALADREALERKRAGATE